MSQIARMIIQRKIGIYKIKYGVTRITEGKEVADYLRLHYSTISRLLKEISFNSKIKDQTPFTFTSEGGTTEAIPRI